MNVLHTLDLLQMKIMYLKNILQIVFNQKFNSSHNQFIDIISNFGKLGILIFLFLLFSSNKNINKFRKQL